MGAEPFSLGKGRQGPGVWQPKGGRGPDAVAPYRIDMSDESFCAVGDIVVCTKAPSKETTVGGVIIPSQDSPFHEVLAVGPLVGEKAGVVLEVGDIVAIEGAAFADTVAGRVWFVRADKILAVVTPKPRPSSDTLPPPPPDEKEPH